MTGINTLFEAYQKAVFQKDLNAFLALFDEEVRIFDMWEQWSFEGLPAWRQMVEGWFSGLGSERDTVEFDDIRVRGAGELITVTAFVRFAAVSEKGEELRHLWNRLTWIVKEQEGVLKIVHQHVSAPTDGATMKARLER